MDEAELNAMSIVEGWKLDPKKYDVDGCIEDIMDGWDPEQSKDEIIGRNQYLD